MSQCQVPGCGQPATHRYLYRYEPSEGHSVPVHSDVCTGHLLGSGDRPPMPHVRDAKGHVMYQKHRVERAPNWDGFRCLDCPAEFRGPPTYSVKVVKLEDVG